MTCKVLAHLNGAINLNARNWLAVAPNHGGEWRPPEPPRGPVAYEPDPRRLPDDE